MLIYRPACMQVKATGPEEWRLLQKSVCFESCILKSPFGTLLGEEVLKHHFLYTLYGGFAGTARQAHKPIKYL